MHRWWDELGLPLLFWHTVKVSFSWKAPSGLFSSHDSFFWIHLDDLYTYFAFCFLKVRSFSRFYPFAFYDMLITLTSLWGPHTFSQELCNASGCALFQNGWWLCVMLLRICWATTIMTGWFKFSQQGLILSLRFCS